MYPLLFIAVLLLLFGFFTTAKFLIAVAILFVLLAFIFPGY